MAALDLCRPHYHVLLITYLKFTKKECKGCEKKRKIKFVRNFSGLKNNKLCNKCEQCQEIWSKPICELIKKFPNIHQFCNGDINKFVLLLRKGVYPYEYMDSWERFDETSLPDKKVFYSELNLEDFTDKDYAYAQRRIKTKEPRWLPWFVCPKWYISACGFMWKLYKQVYWNIWTWPCLFFVCTWINMASLFKKVKLVLLTDIDMLLIVEKGIGGVICH